MNDKEKQKLSRKLEEDHATYFTIYGELEMKFKAVMSTMVQEHIEKVIKDHEAKERVNHEELMAKIDNFISDSKKYVDENKEAIKAIKNLVTGTSFMRGMLIWVAGWIIPIGVIIGAIYGIKEWIKK